MSTRRTRSSKTADSNTTSTSSTPTTTTTTTKRTTSATKVDSPPLAGSPYLPTPLEAILLSIYPGTLLFGSIFSTLHPAARAAPYQHDTQSYAPGFAPSYFAKKSNVFNQYFVKIGWFWTTLAFFLLVFSHPSLGPPLSFTRRRAQAAVRWVMVTLSWIAVTQWFFGAPIIDRSFRWTGGQCEIVLGHSLNDKLGREQMGDMREVVTSAACKAIGGRWRGGHDISGHVFLLILGSAMLWLELLPAVLRMEGLREARRIVTDDSLVRSASVEMEEPVAGGGGEGKELGIGIKVALGVAGLSWWMLLMTAAYFHTWFEKFTGFLVAFGTIYMVYFLPRAVPALRRITGLPGV